MAKYFKAFPQINYKFADGTTQTLKDINIKYQLSDVVKNTTDVFYRYTWKDSDRPDSLADKYYDSSNFYWLVMQSNGIFDLNYELPMSEFEFNQYLFKKYKENVTSQNLEEVLTYTTETIHHYEDSDGDVVDLETFVANGGKSVSIYEYEFQENENKRNIKLIESFRAADIEAELETKLKNIKAE